MNNASPMHSPRKDFIMNRSYLVRIIAAIGCVAVTYVLFSGVTSLAEHPQAGVDATDTRNGVAVALATPAVRQ